MTEESRVIKRFKSFVLGICSCGCGEEINIRSSGILRRYKNYHGTRGDRNYFWSGGKVFDKDGYVLIKQNDHPFKNARGYVQEHRLVMERMIGRYITKNEVIHHVNRIKDDNRIENLMLFESHSKHITFERTGLKRKYKKYCMKNKQLSVKHRGRPQKGIKN